MATMTINVNGNPILPCGTTFGTGGSLGIYEVDIDFGSGVGYSGINYDAQGVPDRFQLYWNNILVADSKYVGNSITGEPPSYPGLLGAKSLEVREYNGTTFVLTGETRDIVVTQDDIANGTTEPTAGVGKIYFYKDLPEPNFARLVVTGAIGGTAWTIPTPGIICPQPTIPT